MSENRYGEKREESETGMKLQNCETQESENKVQESTNEQIKDMGQVVLNSNSRKHKVELLTIIGEVEGHESAPSHSKTTKYEHVLPKLAIIEDDEEIEGLLILLNTVGAVSYTHLDVYKRQVLMERAALKTVEEIVQRLKNKEKEKILVVCGRCV